MAPEIEIENTEYGFEVSDDLLKKTQISFLAALIYSRTSLISVHINL